MFVLAGCRFLTDRMVTLFYVSDILLIISHSVQPPYVDKTEETQNHRAFYRASDLQPRHGGTP